MGNSISKAVPTSKDVDVTPVVSYVSLADLGKLTRACEGATKANSSMVDFAKDIFGILEAGVPVATVAKLEKSKSSTDAQQFVKELMGNRTEATIKAMEDGYVQGYASKGGRKFDKLIGLDSHNVWTDKVEDFHKGSATMQLGAVECWKYVSDSGVKLVNLLSKKSLKDEPSNKTLYPYIKPVHDGVDGKVRRSRQWCNSTMLAIVKEKFDVTPEPPAPFAERFIANIDSASKMQLGKANNVAYKEAYASDTQKAISVAWATLKELARKTI
jgi:hypothetical protein